jgi:hypothetical protein
MSRLRHRWSGMLAVGALVLSVGTDVIRAAGATQTGTYRAKGAGSSMRYFRLDSL